MPDNMVRINLTVPKPLLKEYDRILLEKMFMSRSEHVRQMMRLLIGHYEDKKPIRKGEEVK